MTKTWLITGSSRGLGRELAQTAAGDGDNVVATARRPAQSIRLREIRFRITHATGGSFLSRARR